MSVHPDILQQNRYKHIRRMRVLCTAIGGIFFMVTGCGANCSNVLFVSYEDIKDDLDRVIHQIANVMGVKLASEEFEQVRYKSSFSYNATFFTKGNYDKKQ